MCLLTLSSHVPMNHMAKPVCMPLIYKAPGVGRKCWVTGWADEKEGDGRMKQISVELLPPNQCSEKYPEAAEKHIFCGKSQNYVCGEDE